MEKESKAMSMQTAEQPKATWISVTPAAREAVLRFLKAEGKESGYLRVSVVGGGCSGLSYNLSFDMAPPAPSDVDADFDGLRVVTDGKSFAHLIGMRLDFSDGLNGKGFTFSNPNAKSTCGCGTSFST
jgi:iron-sulfur cluster assembly protein